MSKNQQFYNNLEIPELYNKLKKLIVQPLLKLFDDSIIIYDEERVYQFSNGVLEYEQFKINLSIPSDKYNSKDCFGVYLHIDIPLYDNLGVLYSPEGNNKFKISSFGSYKIIDNFFPEINENKVFTFDECITFAKKVTNLFLKSYQHRQELIIMGMKSLYKNIETQISFKELEVDFLMRVTKNRNKYIFFYSEKLNIVFFNDVFKTNYKSVTNGIEEIATALINKVPDINFETVQWKNIFININNSGIIFQDINLKVKKKIYKKNWIQKYLFGEKDEEHFIEYSSPDFSTEFHLEKDKCIEIWNNLLK